MGAQAGNDVLDVVDREHDATNAPGSHQYQAPTAGHAGPGAGQLR
jgi:hypothetical protein